MFIKVKFDNHKIILSVCSILFLISNIDITITNIALPTIANDFSVNLLSMDSVVVSFLVAYAVAIPLVEFMVDRFGLKNILIIACCLFAISSLLCAVSTNVDQLILSRILQGISSGFFTPIARSIVIKISDVDSLPINLSNVQTLGMLGQAIGPFIGSYVVHLLDWKYIFYINIPLCVIAVFIIILFFDNHTFNKKVIYNLDYKGYSLISIFIIFIFLLLNDFGNGIYYNKNVFISGLIALVLFYLLLNHILNYKDKPILNFKLLFSNNTLKHSLWISLIARQYTSGLSFFIMIFFHELHYTNISLGYILFSYGIGIWFSKILVKHMFFKFKIINIIQYALIILFLLNTTLFGLLSDFQNLTFSMILVFIMGIIISLFHSALNIYAFSSVNKLDSLSVSSFISLLIYLSQSYSIALFSIIIYLTNGLGMNHYLIAEFILSLTLIHAFILSMNKCYHTVLDW